MGDFKIKHMTKAEQDLYNQRVQLRRIERAQETLGATKHDSGTEKPSMGLLPQAALREVAKVMDFGAKKYTKHNWRNGFDHSRLYDAILRHVGAYIDGEDLDPETGLSHIAHATCGCLFLMEHILKDIGTDDRYKPEEVSVNGTVSLDEDRESGAV